MRLVDTHAHLDFPELSGDLDGVFRRARENTVIHIITVGIDIERSEQSIAIAGTFPHVSATVGIHPHGAHVLSSEEQDTLRRLLTADRVVAAGEIGLDYYRDHQPRTVQKECLMQQLEIAIEVQKPVVFHIRDAFEDFLSLVQPYVSRLKGGVVHCFSADWEIAKRCMSMGFVLSIPGVVTYENANTLHNVVRNISLEALLLETDAPFLAPVPYRGKPNEPSYVLHTAQKIAHLKGREVEEVAEITTQNAIKVFRLEV